MHHPRSLTAAAAAALVLATLAAPPGARAESAWVASTGIRIVDLDSGAVVGSLCVAEHQVVREITFDAAGETAFVASMGGLFEVDARTLGVRRRLSDRPAASVSVTEDGRRLAALLLPYPGEALADRERGLPPTSTLLLVDRSGGDHRATAELHGAPLRVALRRDGERVAVLDAAESEVVVFEGEARRLGRIPLAVDGTPEPGTVCPDMAMGGGRLAVVCNGPSGSDLVLVWGLEDPATAQLRVRSLGPERRARGAAFSADGRSVLVTAIGYVARLAVDGPDERWEEIGHQMSRVAAAPSGDYLVFSTPTLDAGRGSGGVAIADEQGRLLRLVEITDISPYTLAIQP